MNNVHMLSDLEPIDLQILRVLQEDARLTTREIGARVHRSHSSVHDRIQRMRRSGVIRRYTVEVDPRQLGLGFIAFTHIQLKDHSEDTLSTFETEIVKFPEVMECHHITGAHDFILVTVARDHYEYHEVLMKKIFRTLGVGHIESKIVMKTAKSGTPLPIR